MFNEIKARENVQEYIIHYLVKYTRRLLCRCMLPVLDPHSASYEHEDYRGMQFAVSGVSLLY